MSQKSETNSQERRQTAVSIWLGLAAGLAAASATPLIPTASMPPSGLMLGYVVMGIIEALAVAVGVAFAVMTWPHVKRSMHASAESTVLMIGTYLSVIWLLVSWWAHGRLHAWIQHDDWGSLLAIEYGFHATSIIAVLVIARWVYGIFRQTNR